MMSNEQIPGMVPTDDGQHAFMIDQNNGHYGWLFRMHPDGQWVSVRKATQDELNAAKAHDALRTPPSECVTDHVALMQQIKADGPEWPALEAGYACVTDLMPHMRKAGDDYVWMGYAVRAAFVAGARWQRNQDKSPETSEEEERVAFELACKQVAARNGRVYEAHYLNRRADGTYLNPMAQVSWTYWLERARLGGTQS